MTDFLVNGDGDRADIVLAHGAGAPMDHEFMTWFAGNLAARGFTVTRFEFPYMSKRRLDGKRRGPDRAPVLLDCYRQVIAGVKRDNVPLVVAGKSMGGRMATMLAADQDARIDGCLVLGYPFHPPGKPEKLRTEHLPDIMVPTLICQGERDTFGARVEVPGYDLGNTGIFWAPDGDHSLKPRKKSGFTEEGNRNLVLDAVDAFFP